MELTAAMLAPLIEGVTTNVGVIVPAGLTLLGMGLAASAIPKFIYKFF